MKASALIELLQAVDADAEIVIAVSDEKFCELRDISTEEKEIVLWPGESVPEVAEDEDDDDEPHGQVH